MSAQSTICGQPRAGIGTETFGAAIDEILRRREAEDVALAGSRNGSNPDQICSGQGSNVALLAALVGLKLNLNP